MDKLKKFLRNPHILYFIFVAVLISFALILNITFSFFTSYNTETIANIKVSSGLDYAISVDGNLTTIIKADAESEQGFTTSLSALNEISSTYELIYHVCTDATCTEYQDAPSGFSVQYSNQSLHAVSGEITATGAKIIRIVTLNETDADIWLKLDVNAGYAHNILVFPSVTVNGFSVSEYEIVNVFTHIITPCVLNICSLYAGG